MRPDSAEMHPLGQPEGNESCLSHNNVLDLFAGPGGLDEGAASLGLTDVLGIEWDEAACATARAAGHKRLLADVSALNPSEHSDGDLYGLLASPPCQGFSLAGKGRGRLDSERIVAAVQDIAAGRDPRDDLATAMQDPRSVLALEPLRWALELEPEWTVWEQVPAVLPLWEACAEALRADGYSVWTGLVYAEQYGVPQTRKRAILGASRSVEAEPPAVTHSRYYVRNPGKVDPGTLRWISMADALGWGMSHRPSMTVTGGGTATGGAEPFGHAARDGMRREIEAGRWVVPAWCFESPAPTVAGDPRIAPRGCKHPREGCCSKWSGTPGLQFGPGTVRVTVREAATLQTFHGDYPWQGTKTAQYRQVGDAVPPLLAAQLISSVTGLPLRSEVAA
jgi:DNA (cytosine-5)-methyltransferase 1